MYWVLSVEWIETRLRYIATSKWTFAKWIAEIRFTRWLNWLIPHIIKDVCKLVIFSWLLNNRLLGLHCWLYISLWLHHLLHHCLHLLHLHIHLLYKHLHLWILRLVCIHLHLLIHLVHLHLVHLYLLRDLRINWIRYCCKMIWLWHRIKLGCLKDWLWWFCYVQWFNAC